MPGTQISSPWMPPAHPVIRNMEVKPCISLTTLLEALTTHRIQHHHRSICQCRTPSSETTTAISLGLYHWVVTQLAFLNNNLLGKHPLPVSYNDSHTRNILPIQATYCIIAEVVNPLRAVAISLDPQTLPCLTSLARNQSVFSGSNGNSTLQAWKPLIRMRDLHDQLGIHTRARFPEEDLPRRVRKLSRLDLASSNLGVDLWLESETPPTCITTPGTSFP